MNRRAFLGALALLAAMPMARANMASPEVFGSRCAAPIMSRQLDVLGETLHIRGFRRLDSATVHARYRIAVPPGLRGPMPLLFVALERGGPLQVLFDGRPVATGTFPVADLQDFLDPAQGRANELVVGFSGGNGGWVLGPDDLVPFTLDLTPGEHTVDVTYTALPWVDRSDWIRETSIRYSLSPARHWKSFGQLEVIVEVPEADGLYRLKEPNEGTLSGRAVWRFPEIPSNTITVSFTPGVDTTARLLMGLSPFGMALIVGFTLLLLHVRWMHRFRMSGRTGVSKPLVIGVLLAPLGFLLAFLHSYDLIDMAIGPDAGRFHGYTFFYLGLYPIITPLYGLGCWLLDRHWKRQAMLDA
ncbi:MAG: hypothetical protein JNL05_10835 [Flavobacteriales bacterium]|nr:hypothetical protein [Flavobacteriales bacterium]